MFQCVCFLAYLYNSIENFDNIFCGEWLLINHKVKSKSWNHQQWKGKGEKDKAERVAQKQISTGFDLRVAPLMDPAEDFEIL